MCYKILQLHASMPVINIIYHVMFVIVLSATRSPRRDISVGQNVNVVFAYQIGDARMLRFELWKNQSLGMNGAVQPRSSL
jgi:hypothetical protein